MSGFGERLNQRQKGFKKATDADEARRKREDAAVQLRKQVKEEALLKKRMVNGAGDEGQQPSPFNVTGSTQDVSLTTASMPPALENLPALVQALHSDDPEVVEQATQHFRKVLSVEVNPPIADVISAGLVPRFVLLLREVTRPSLQFEAAWVLTNIASGTAEQTKTVVEHGALPVFVELLQSPNEDVREQAVWALGNIAGDCPTFRDLVLQSGGLHPISQLLTNPAQSTKATLMRNATWALSNLCRGKPPPPLEWVLPGLPTLNHLLQSTDAEVLADACWALSYLSDGTSERIMAVIQSGVCPRLVSLLGHQAPSVQTPVLRTVGNIVTGDAEQTQHMLQCGILAPLSTLLQHTKKAIRKETCWTISNITAGTESQIQEVINAGLIPPVLHLLQTAEFDIKREAAWAISNALAGGSPQQLAYLIKCECIGPLCNLLSQQDSKIVGVALDAMDKMLAFGKNQMDSEGLEENPVVRIVEEVDGMSKIEALQNDENVDVYGKAVHILKSYFPLEDDVVFPESQVAGGDSQAFAFGAAAMPAGGFNFGC